MLKTLVEKQLSSVKSFSWELSISLIMVMGLFYGFVISDSVPKEVGGVLLCCSFCWQRIFIYQAAKIVKSTISYNKTN